MSSKQSLNSSHKLHLLTSFKYVDDLLSEVEAILFTSASKSPFPKYRADLLPVQTKVIEDYIARIRAQMIQVLKSQGVSPPGPRVGATHSIWVNLEFADIAFDECRPDALRGYGEVPESLIPEVTGLVEEMRSLVRKLSSYLTQGLGQDLAQRIERLERTTDEVEPLKLLERIINQHGLVEFRSTLSIVLDRIESNSFQIAVFGRVSSGKSSLLNYITEMDVLPVGVNPITAVPTRIVRGSEPRLTVAYLDNKRETMEIGRLPEFVSEQFNPGNAKHVTRIMAELPSRRLQDGVVFVDTPGLGSLATSGAAETLAYLPQCDLGVVLVDAGSTLNQEDLSTVQSLYEAAIPAFVLLSKADLLSAEDRVRSLQYISTQIKSQLGLTVSVDPVSTKGEHTSLLDHWFEDKIQPLCEHHQELARQSVRRKVGALLDRVEAALRVRLEATDKGTRHDTERLSSAEGELRKATGKFEDVNTWSLRASDEIRALGGIALARAAAEIAERLFSGDTKDSEPQEIVLRNLVVAAAEGANQIFDKIHGLAGMLSQALGTAAHVLGVKDTPQARDLTAVVKELPRLDPGPIEVSVRRDFRAVFGRGFMRRRVENKLREQVGPNIDEAFERYRRMLESWTRRTLAELHRQFDAHADAYRAQIERLTNTGPAAPEETASILGDLEALARFQPTQAIRATADSHLD
jgi:GTP-binding protein EngB required for normal cell division